MQIEHKKTLKIFLFLHIISPIDIDNGPLPSSIHYILTFFLNFYKNKTLRTVIFFGKKCCKASPKSQGSDETCEKNYERKVNKKRKTIFFKSIVQSKIRKKNKQTKI